MDSEQTQPSPTWRFWIVVSLLYAACIVVSTYPFLWNFTTQLPTSGDPPQHLWIMRWYKSCMLEGRLPFFCPELQYPFGVPLGNFSPLTLESLLFFPI